MTLWSAAVIRWRSGTDGNGRLPTGDMSLRDTRVLSTLPSRKKPQSIKNFLIPITAEGVTLLLKNPLHCQPRGQMAPGRA